MKLYSILAITILARTKQIQAAAPAPNVIPMEETVPHVDKAYSLTIIDAQEDRGNQQPDGCPSRHIGSPAGNSFVG